MRRFVVPGVALGLLLAPAASANLPLPTPTCAYPEPSFGVRVDEGARAMGALDNIYVDGVVAVPVRLGLSLSNLQKPSDLVDRGLANLDVADSNGVALTGTLELAMPTTPTVGEGQAAWLVWVGAEPFQPSALYEVEYSFVNDQLSDCPEAVPLAGTLTFKTGTRSATEDLVTPSFATTTLQSQVVMDPGCCAAPDAKPCLTEGKCYACWDSFIAIGSAQALITSPLPPSYFRIDFSLFADDRPQTLTSNQGGYAIFTVTDQAPEYCFHADLRPRAHVDDLTSTDRCVSSADGLPLALQPPYTALPFAECAEAPPLQYAGDGVVFQALFGTTEDEAKSALRPTQPPLPMTGTTPRPGSAVSQRSSSCALGRGGTDPQAALCLLGLLLFARRRR